MTQEIEHEGVGRAFIDLVRGPGLLDPSMVHDDNPVSHLQGLFLVVGDEDTGYMDLVVEPPQPAAQFSPHLGVQGAEGFVEEEHLRFHRQGPSQGDPLSLTTGELGRIAVGQPFKLHQLEQVMDLLLDIFLGGACRTWFDIQAEGHVIGYGQVPEQGVVLKDEADAALAHVSTRHIKLVKQDLGLGGNGRSRSAGVRRLQTGDDAQQRGLSRSRGAEKRHQLPVRHRQVHVAQRLKCAKGFADIAKFDAHKENLNIL